MELVQHNKNWKSLYQSEAKKIKSNLGDAITRIEHIGSTSIPTIAAKPIVDIAVLPKHFEDIEFFKDSLGDLGYTLDQSRSSSERHFFTKGQPIPLHLSIANPKTDYLQRQVLFRDYLIEHPDAAKEYEDLKMKLIQEDPSARKQYSDGKGNFIKKILIRSRNKNYIYKGMLIGALYFILTFGIEFIFRCNFVWEFTGHCAEILSPFSILNFPASFSLFFLPYLLKFGTFTQVMFYYFVFDVLLGLIVGGIVQWIKK